MVRNNLALPFSQ